MIVLSFWVWLHEGVTTAALAVSCFVGQVLCSALCIECLFLLGFSYSHKVAMFYCQFVCLLAGQCKNDLTDCPQNLLERWKSGNCKSVGTLPDKLLAS